MAKRVMKSWWRRLYFWLTHAGQWASPEWNLDPEPNMGPPWPETEHHAMRETFICRSAVRNNGIVKVHLTRDDMIGQSVEIVMNTTEDVYREGDHWLVQMTLIQRRGRS